MCRPRYFFLTGILFLYGAYTLVEPFPAFDRFALGRCYRTDAAAPWPRAEISTRNVLGQHGRPPFDTDLPLQLWPKEQQAGMGIGQQLRALPAMVVRKKRKSVGRDVLKQHNARRWLSLARYGRERHRVGLHYLRADRFVKPL